METPFATHTRAVRTLSNVNLNGLKLIANEQDMRVRDFESVYMWLFKSKSPFALNLR